MIEYIIHHIVAVGYSCYQWVVNFIGEDVSWPADVFVVAIF